MKKQQRYYVYIASSSSWTLYAGITNNLERRVKEHKEKVFSGFTSRYNINRLVYYEAFHDVYAAIRREKQIKAWTRAKRVALVKSFNPNWDDFSREWGEQIGSIYSNKTQIPR